MEPQVQRAKAPLPTGHPLIGAHVGQPEGSKLIWAAAGFTDTQWAHNGLIHKRQL